MRECPLCPESWIYLSLTLILTALLAAFSLWLAIPGLILLGFLLWFFRNPVRAFKPAADLLYAPCDAQVMSITEIDDPDIGQAIKITMFLSVFNVHVNRVPLTAQVVAHEYKPGLMLPAFKPHAAEENERNRLVFETANGYRYAVHQITGILARRIVWDVEVGQLCQQGQRFGMIKFGSCTELIVPRTTPICVKPGDRVRGVKTVIAQCPTPVEAPHAD